MNIMVLVWACVIGYQIYRHRQTLLDLLLEVFRREK
jgi:hypothetical protein